MKSSKWMCAFLFALIAVQGVVEAREGVRPLRLNNRLRFEYDDNIYQADTDKTDSFKIIEELEFLYNVNLDQTFLSLRYRPSFIWWADREPDDTDLQHEFDLVVNHAFTPRLGLSIVNTLRRGEQAELIERDVLVREQADFYYNSLNASLNYAFRPQTRLELAGRYVLLRYDQDDVADREDFDIYVAGMTLRQQVLPKTTVLGELRFEMSEYSGPDRGADSLFVGAGAEQTFSPNLLGSVRGGYQRKEFSAEQLGSVDSPYVDASVTVLPSPATRLTAGFGFSQFETDVFPYANQERTVVFASLAHDLTARIAFYLTGSLTRGDFNAEESLNPAQVTDGSEDVVQVSTRVTYRVNRSNWIEAGWQYVEFDSDLQNVEGADLRLSYDRNRVDLGWRTQF